MSSQCLSGVLQATVSRHQKRKSVRNKRLLCQMQSPRGKKCVNLATLWSAVEPKQHDMTVSVISGRFVTMRASVTATPAGPPLSVMCCIRSCLKVSYMLHLSVRACKRWHRICACLTFLPPCFAHGCLCLVLLCCFSPRFNTWNRFLMDPQTIVLCLVSTAWHWLYGIPPLVMQ